MSERQRPDPQKLGPADSLGPPSVLNRPGEVFVDELFDELMDLPPDEREAALERRTADDSVRAEVRALLSVAEEPPAETPALTEGDHIGHYRLGRTLGTGASGSVWTAFDTRLESWTALKLFHGERLPTSRALDSVMREARAASGIISDHVVLIRNVGEDTPSGLHFIEMLLCAEYRADDSGQERLVVGRSLHEDPPDDLHEAVRLAAEACRGAEAAHRVGVVHRDIKPANILVMPVSGRALVADFGLSAPALGASVVGAKATETVSIAMKEGGRTIVGTPCFMAPEQARGEPATRQSDVYALGATLYTLLAGRAPYLEPGNSKPDALTIVKRAREGAPRHLAELAPRTPPRLLRIVERAMARAPGDRYPTAAALAADLEAWRTYNRTSLDGRNPGLAAWLFGRRHPGPVATGAVLSMMLLAFGVSTAWLSSVKDELEADVSRLEERRTDAEAQAAAAERRAEFAARGAGEAAKGAEEAAQSSREAAAHATEARVKLEEVTAWARTETERARQDRQDALEQAADADRQAAQAEVERARADEARAAAEMAAAAAAADLAEARSRLVEVRGERDAARREREAEAARHRGTLMRQVEVESRLTDAQAQVEALEARIRELATGGTGPLP